MGKPAAMCRFSTIRALAAGRAKQAVQIVALSCVTVITASHGAAQDEPLAFTERLSQTISRRMASDDVAGLVVVLLEDGASVWTRAFGVADPATGRAMTEDALFRVESIAKPVTAWGTMRLAQNGQFDLDAPVIDCLTGWHLPIGLPAITARQLLSHTAGTGLGDYSERYPPDAKLPDLETHLAEDFTMVAPPGTHFAYSDTGFNLLELMIETCTGEDFAALMDRDLFAPLGMEGASFDWTGAEMPVGHDLRGCPVAPYVYPGRASGGLHATAHDIARFVAAGMVGSAQDVLSEGAVADLHRPVVEVDDLFGFAADGYGLGHFTETLSDGRAAVWHGGQGYGWMSHLHMVPQSGDGIVILSNSQRAWPLFAAILRDWSDRLGVAPVGMTHVLLAETAARVVIVILWIVAVAAVGLVLLRDDPAKGFVRICAGGVSAALILWPLWAATQDYLFLFSILPGLWKWLGIASVAAGLGLAWTALRPGSGASAG